MPIAEGLFGLLADAANAAARRYRANHPDGISLGQFKVLSKLIHAGPQHQRALCAMTGIDRSTMSAMLPTMVRNGLITLYRSQADRRVTRATVTPRGLEEHGKALKAVMRAEKELAKALNISTFPIVRNALHKLAEVGADA